MTKTCPMCKLELSVSEYWNSKTNKDGLASYCKKCASQKYKNWFSIPENKAKRALGKRVKTPEDSRKRRNQRLKKEYGMTVEDYDRMLEKQGNKWVSRGGYKRLSPTKLEINELPVGFWTADFKEMIEAMIINKDDKYKNCPIKSYESHYTPTVVNFVLHFTSSSALDEWLTLDTNGYTKLENELKLISSKNLGTSNMYAFNEKGQITKYDTALDIIKAFYSVRHTYYVKRKEHILDKLNNDMKRLNNKIRFVKDVINGVIIVHKLKKSELEDTLQQMQYDKMDDSYDYLTRIPIYNFTIDKVEELKDEIAKKESALKATEDTTVEQMWSDDLDAFMGLYENDVLDIEYDSNFPTSTTKTIMKKTITRKTPTTTTPKPKVTLKKK